MTDTKYTFRNGSTITGRVLGTSTSSGRTTARIEGWIAYDANADLYNEAIEDDDVAEFDITGARRSA